MRTLFILFDIKSILIGFYLCLSSSLYAQYTLSGKVTDTEHAALDKVGIALEQNSTFVSFTLTDEKGKYIFKDIPKGNYEIILTYIGCKGIRQPVTLNGDSTQDFCMEFETGEVQLDEVVVEADKSDVVISQAQSTRFFLSKHARNLQNPYEALQEIPKLIVNHSEKKITLNNGVTPAILVNGNRFNAGLDGLDPNDIEAVEIIEVPSARYLKDGIQAIVNFKVKRKNAVYQKFNMSTKQMLPILFGFSNAFYETGNSTFSLNVTGRHFYFHNDDADWMRTQQNTTYQKQTEGGRRYKMQNYYVALNTDWICSSKDYLSLNITYLSNPSRYKSEGSGLLDTQDEEKQSFTFIDNDKVRYYINTYNLFYKHTFKEKTYLEFTGNFNLNGNNTYGLRKETYPSQAYETLYDYDNFRRSGGMELYFTTPYKKQVIELGSKVDFNNDQLKQVTTHYPTFYNKERNGYFYGGANGYITSRMSYAASIGLDLISRKTDDIKVHYCKLAASASVNYRFVPSFSLRMAYRLTNTPPTVGQLNPYNVSTDSLVSRKGNPYLRPVQRHQWEIAPIFNKNGFYVEPSFSYSLYNDVIERAGYTDPVTGVFTETYGNNRRYSILSASINLRYNNRQWGGIGMGVENLTKYYESQGGKNLFRYKLNFFGWRKKWSWNGYLSYMPCDYDVYSKTRYDGAESEVTLSYKITKQFSVNAGMRYWLGMLKNRTYVNEETYSSYSSFDLKDRSYKVMVGFAYYMQGRNATNRSKKQWEDKETGIKLK